MGTKYEKDDLEAYVNYTGGPIPQKIERTKYGLSCSALTAQNKGDYLEVIECKLQLAKICQSQGKKDDAFMLEDGIRKAYFKLSSADKKKEAKEMISQYNSDMAKYIDQDKEETVTRKEELCKIVLAAQNKGDYLKEIEYKLEIAKICQSQGQKDNAFLLEDGIRKTYFNLSSADKKKAKEMIFRYSSDMAKNIDQDALTSIAEEAQNKREYLKVINYKLELAKICQSQDKKGDAFTLEEGIRKTYVMLSSADKEEAKEMISQYNSDMARYIDQDVSRY